MQKFKGEKTSWLNVLKGATPTPEDLTTRLFLRYIVSFYDLHQIVVFNYEFQTSFVLICPSHKRSTGQGLVGRLYEGLKDWYQVFLDSEAKFNIHDLKCIVQSTEVFVFVLTHGILMSYWCLEELTSALQNNKKVMKSYHYSLYSGDNN